MSNYFLSELDLVKIEKKTIISVNQSLNQNGEVIEIVILLDSGNELYISSDNDEALIISMN
jgi:hypothetical protein